MLLLTLMLLQYVAWSPTARGSLLHTISHGIVGDAGTPDAFFTDATCRQHFKVCRRTSFVLDQLRLQLQYCGSHEDVTSSLGCL